MAKYIDAEKLKRLVGELKKHAERNRCDVWGIVPDALEEVDDFITSLQQEQISFPDNLDEAAEKYGREDTILPEDYNDGDIPLYERWTADAFKAGAEWMAGRLL